MSKSGLVPRVQCPRPVLLTPTACHPWKSGENARSQNGEKIPWESHILWALPPPSTPSLSISQQPEQDQSTSGAERMHFRVKWSRMGWKPMPPAIHVHRPGWWLGGVRQGVGGGQPRCSNFSPEHQPEPPGAKKSSCRNWEILFEGDFAL